MLFVLGVGSAVGLQSAIITNMMDQFPKLKYWQVAAGCSTCGFIVGLMYVTPGGQWMLTLVDYFGGTFLVFALAIIEIIAIFWIYGLENICNDLEFMLNRHVTLYWRLCWGVVTPCLMLLIFLYSLVNFASPTYSKLHFPDGYLAAGWAIFAIGMLQLPLWGAWVVSRKNEGNISKVIIVKYFNCIHFK